MINKTISKSAIKTIFPTRGKWFVWSDLKAYMYNRPKGISVLYTAATDIDDIKAVFRKKRSEAAADAKAADLTEYSRVNFGVADRKYSLDGKCIWITET